MKAGIELKRRFTVNTVFILAADELEEVFDARVLKMPTVHETTNLLLHYYRFRLCQLMMQDYVILCLRYVSLWFKRQLNCRNKWWPYQPHPGTRVPRLGCYFRS